MRTRLTGLLICVLFAGACPCWGHNTYFLPGDAFFHTVLTEDVVDSRLQMDNPSFAYSRPDPFVGAACGDAGYYVLEFVNMPKAFKENLQRAYLELSKLKPKKDETKNESQDIEKAAGSGDADIDKETAQYLNGFSLFFYNASFDFRKYRLCVKYNERWVKETAAFGHGENHVQLDSFVDSFSAFSDEWRDSAAVEPLNATCPALPNDDADGATDWRTVRVESGIRAIVLPVKEFDRYGAPDGADTAGAPWFLDVTESGIKRFVHKNGNWRLDGADKNDE